MRIDKPIGFLLLMWPVLWAFLISSDGSPNIFYMIIFAFGIIFTRSAGCIINDYFDHENEKVDVGRNREEEKILISKDDKNFDEKKNQMHQYQSHRRPNNVVGIFLNF